MLFKMRERLQTPEAMPELFDARRVEEEREMIDTAIRSSAGGMTN